jgi:oxaloacetate decarboxylase alpha subunit
MADIEFIDTTLRDGQQCHWGMRMQAGQALPVTPLIDKVGYEVVDLGGSSLFEVLIRYCQEDPWEGMDLLVASMPNTRFRAGMRTNAAVTFSVSPDSIMDLWMRRLCAHGMDTVWIYDVLLANADKAHRLAKVAKETDAMVVIAIFFADSPVHTDAFYAERTKLYAASPDVDRFLIYDASGVLTPERVRTLIPAIQAEAGGRTLELICHNSIGIAAHTYLAALDLGVDRLYTCNRPLSDGPAPPSVDTMARNIEMAGHSHGLDLSHCPAIEENFRKVAKAMGYSVGVPQEYDLFYAQHQVPGGMTGTFKNQLAQQGMPEKYDEVLREAAVVRRELGYPGMATPFSQLVGTLAVLNIVTAKRYSVIPDEVIQYAAGHYGEPVGEIDPDILDRIMSAPRAKVVANTPPPQPTLEELRKQLGPGLSDDELFLRALVPESDIEKMRAAGPVQRDYPTLSSPQLEAVASLIKTAGSNYLYYQDAETTLVLRRGD